MVRNLIISIQQINIIQVYHVSTVLIYLQVRFAIQLLPYCAIFHLEKHSPKEDKQQDN